MLSWSLFFKPQQDKQELAKVRIELLDEQACSRDDELRRSLKIKNEFLNNISHEVRSPVTGIASLSQSLNELYEELSEVQCSVVKLPQL